MNAIARAAAVGLLGLLATGCAKFTNDGGMAPVTESIRKEIGRDAVKLSSREDVSRARELPSHRVAAWIERLEGRSSDRTERPPKLG